jgi:hypothetical protein
MQLKYERDLVVKRIGMDYNEFLLKQKRDAKAAKAARQENRRRREEEEAAVNNYFYNLVCQQALFYQQLYQQMHPYYDQPHY